MKEVKKRLNPKSISHVNELLATVQYLEKKKLLKKFSLINLANNGIDYKKQSREDLLLIQDGIHIYERNRIKLLQ